MTHLLQYAHDFSNSFAPLLWAAAWQSAVIGLLISAIVVTRKRWASSLRYWLLVIALVKFLIPPFLALPTGLLSHLPATSSVTTSSLPDRSETPVSTDITPPIRKVTRSPANVTPESAENSFTPSPNPPSRPSATPIPIRPSAPWPWTTLAVSIYFLGLLTASIQLFRQQRRLARIVRRSNAGNETLAAEVATLSRQLQLNSSIHLRISTEIQTPMAFGLLRPTILLPGAEWQSFTPSDRKTVLLHELAHIKRRDPWINALQLLVRLLWWCHPIAYLVNELLFNVREECCDDLLLQQKFATPAEYSETLLRSVSRVQLARLPLVLEIARHPLEPRLRRILDNNIPRLPRLNLVSASLILLTAAFLLPGINNSQAREPKSSDVNPDSTTTQTTPIAAPPSSTNPKKIATPNSQSKPAPGVTLVSAQGVVVDDVGKPIQGATVHLREWSMARFNGKPGDEHPQDLLTSTTTDEQGRFSFQNVPSTILSIPNMPYEFPWDVIAISPGFGMTGAHLTSIDGKKTISLKLSPAAEITGRLVDQTGTPVKDAVVSVNGLQRLDASDFSGYPGTESFDFGYSQIAPQTVSNAEGRFTFRDLPGERRIPLMIKHPKFTWQYELAATTKTPQPDLVRPNRSRDGKPTELAKKIHTGDFQIPLKPAGKISGTLRFADTGLPVAEATVAIHSLNSPYRRGMTDSEGKFEFDSAPLDENSLFVWPLADGKHIGINQVVHLSDTQREQAVELSLPVGEIQNGIILDEATGKGVAGVNVESRNLDTSKPETHVPAQPTVSNDEGQFSLPLPPGKFNISIKGPLTGYDLPDRYTRLTPEASKRYQQSVEVVAGTPAPELNFKIGQGLIIEGVATDEDQKPVSDAEIQLIPRFPRTSSKIGTTDASGRFRIVGLPMRGLARLVFTHKERRLKGRIQVDELPDSDLTTQKLLQMNCSLKPVGQITGIVNDGFKGLPDVKVLLYEQFKDERGSTGAGPIGIQAVTDDEGKYTLDFVEPGREFHVSVQSPEGYEHSSRYKLISVQPNSTYDHAPITIRRVDQFVAGIVVDPEGNPVEGATISASDRTTGLSISLYRGESTTTGADGRFRMQHLPNIPLSLMAFLRAPPDSADRLIRNPGKADAEPGQTNVKIVLDQKLQRPRIKKLQIKDGEKK